MPRFGPIKRKDLLGYLKRLGFAGPYSGGKHQFMIRDNITLRIPNPHQSDIGKELLARILKQAAIERDEWESFKEPLCLHSLDWLNACGVVRVRT